MLVKSHNPLFLKCRPISKEILLKSIFFLFIATFLFICGPFSDAHAAEVTLAWNASSASDLAGYNLYYLRCSLDEDCSIDDVEKSQLQVYQIENDGLDDPSNPQVTLYQLSDEHKFSFALTAYISSGDESDFSNEVNFTPPNSSSSTDSSTGTATDTSTGEKSSSGNAAPTVEAGANQTISLSTGKAVLSGTVTDDGLPDGDEIVYKWHQSKGSGTATFADPSSPKTTVSFDALGNYTLVLSANDGELASSDSLLISVVDGDTDTSDTTSTDDGTSTDTDSDGSDETIIIDNSDIDSVSSEGTWKESCGTDPNGDNSVFGKNGSTFTWQFVSTNTGTYNLSMWWTYHYTRNSAVPISIESEDGVEVVTVNQQENAAQWVELGSYNFVAGETYNITVTAPDEGSKTACADAIKLTYSSESSEYISGNEIILDNLDTDNISSTGTWKESAGKDPYGDNSVYGKQGATFSWTYQSATSGTQDVSIRWTYHRTRSSSVSITVESSEGSKEIVVDQQQNASSWVSLGSFSFTEGESYNIKITAPDKGYQTACADAVKITYSQN